MTGFLQLDRVDGARRLAGARPGAETRTWDFRGREAPPELGRELTGFFADADRVVTFGSAELSEALSAPAILRETRLVLGRLVDAREAALLLTPLLEAFSLDALCEAVGATRPSAGEPGSLLDRWTAVTRRMRERAGSLAPQTRSVIAAVAGPVWCEALLGPAEGGGRLGRAIGALLPRRPKRTPRRPVELSPGLKDLAPTILGPDGAVASAHPAYEHRPGQVQMACAVAEAFARDEFLLVEAGTGTGKSLAYLLPAIAFARARGEPVLVSTNTKNLQDQLIQRDLPLAGTALGLEFSAELLKGRTNYVCPRLLTVAAERAQESVFRDDRLALAHLIAWAAQAPIADLDGLSPEAFEAAPALRGIVPLVRARSEACSGRRCSHYSSCPVEVARARAQNADVVVVNHALLLAGTGTAALPEHHHLVIDEAHNLEDVATDQLGREASDASVRGLLRLLSGEDAAPLNQRVAEWLGTVSIEAEEAVAEACAAFPEAVAALEYALEDLAAAVLSFLEHAPSLDRAADRSSIRLTSDTRGTRHWMPVVAALPPVSAAIEGVRAVLTIFLHALHSSGQELTDAVAALALDVEQPATLLSELDSALAVVVQGEQDRDFVCWVSGWTTRRGETGWSLRAAPIDVGPALQSALYEGLRTAVMTSATLTVDDDFDYLRQRLGLDAEADRLLELAVPSPFDFPNQLLLCIPSDLPLPGERSFDEACHEAIAGAAEAAAGGTLCLFTSRESMARAYDRLRPRLERGGLTPICQDLAASRTAALEALRDDPTAVLFGVKSFWEGVDVPGEALRCLVMAKLPFAVPSDPIVQARQERIEEQGRNGYDEFYVPNAVIGFRQGIGRLIRTRTDRGAVFVLDRRILLRRYGTRFLQSIPACRVERGPLGACLAQTSAMLGVRT